MTDHSASRRSVLAGLMTAPVAGAAAGAMLGAAAAPAGAATRRRRSGRIEGPIPEGFRAGPLDLSKPLDNLVALLKLQADLSGAPVYGGFPGKAWAWIPDEGNVLLFNTYGIGASRLAWSPEDQAFRLMHREALFYCDPKSGEVLDVWTNPLTGARLDVLHILNDPVNRVYRLKGGPLAPPYPYMTNGDRLVFQLDVLRGSEKSPMSRREYPLHAQQDLYQSGELWAISGSLDEINDPKITSASCHTSWKRVSPWLPFMEMGNRPGLMIYHSQSFKFMDGWGELPEPIRRYTEKNHPTYLEAPSTWDGLARNENTWTYSKKEIDARRAAGRDRNGSVFGRDGN